METDFVPGVILTNQYSTAGTAQGFSQYLNYISRENAVAPKEFAQYMNYMDNPEKQANLFTPNKDFLTREEKESLKEKFSEAEQKNGVMWETVISFRNDWLEEHGLYRSSDGWTDEEELKRLTRGAVKQIEKENHVELVWTGAIHHNTDNIHVHIASVERVPYIREKEYRIVEFPEDWLDQHGVLTPENLAEMRTGEVHGTTKAEDGTLAYRDTMSRLKTTILDETEMPFFCKNQIEWTKDHTIRVLLNRSPNAGRIPDGAKVVGTIKMPSATFSEKSMTKAKQYLTKEILRDNDSLKRINSIIRDEIVSPARENLKSFLQEDEDIARDFLKLYHDLSASGINRRDWNYSENKISKLRPELDKLSDKILEQKFPEEARNLQQAVSQTAEEYRRANGQKDGDDYEKNRKKEFHKRMGNAILSNLKQYDRQKSNEQRVRSQSKQTGKSKAKKSSSKKRISKPRTAPDRLSSGSGPALQYALRQMEWDVRQILYAGEQEEQEQLNQFQQEIAEEAYAERRRIQQGQTGN